MYTSVKWLKGSAAALVVATCMAAAPALADEGPTDPQARMGFPPGVTSSTTITAEARMGFPPGVSATDDAAATAPPEARLGRQPGEPVETSMWGAFLSWLQEQAQLIANQ
jgi:hypothetical protein